jgi:hypothetical protein
MSKLAQEYFKARGWRYYLQGSRSKGYHVPQSDWDYYLDDGYHSTTFPRYGELLQDWVGVVDCYYLDASTTYVFEKHFLDGKVQVSCRKHFELMCRAWGGVTPEFYGTYLNKRSALYLGKEFTMDFVDNLYHSELNNGPRDERLHLPTIEWINE